MGEKENKDDISNYKESLEKWNSIMKEYRIAWDKIFSTNALRIAMDTAVKRMENIIPKRNVMNEALRSVDYLGKRMNEIYDKKKLINAEYILKLNFQYWDLLEKNKYFSDTINLCMNEILDSTIKLKNIYSYSNIWSIDILPSLKSFSEEDKEIVLDDVKKIVDIAKKEDKNIEQRISEQVEKIKKKHPVTLGIIGIIINLLINYFIQGAQEIYNYNYNYNYSTIINNNFTNDTSQDFFDNARFVVANKLNLREGPDKSYEVISVLEQGMIVKVINQVKYWTQIEYINKENNIQVKGWVYTRYLKAFDIDSLINN